MEHGGSESRDSSHNPTLKAIASRGRREILGVLVERDSPATEQELATHLAATGDGRPAGDVTAERVRAVRTDLAHTHLPVLVDAGLVTHDRTEGTVTTASHPALEDPRFRRLLAVDDDFDAALSALAHERRRVVLTALRDAETPLSRSELAREVLASGAGTTEPETAAVERVAASLHHLHLPKLDGDGLVEYDPGNGRVAYADHRALETTFRIVREPDDRLVEKFDGFLGGLESSYRRAGRSTDGQVDWLHLWRDPHHG